MAGNGNQDSGLLTREKAAALGILVLVYTFNFIDRQIVGILAVPIKADLGLTDAQLGLMGGLAFALFYTGLGIPVAMLADRYSRTWIMTWALVIWSGMTAVCGLATNFWQLFMARLGVGIGEAGGVAPAYSLISDLFPQEQRARALSIYSFGIPIGSALGIVFGGVIAFGVALDYMNGIGFDRIASYEKKLLEYATEKLLEIEGLRIYGTSAEKASVISFNIEGIHPYDIGAIIDKLGIAVRTGHHCAQPIMDFYQIPGTVRASFAFYNTKEEIDIFVEAVKRAQAMLS